MRRTTWYKLLPLFCGLIVLLLGLWAFAGIGGDGPVHISRLDFENADIRQIMKTLSEIGNRNIIVDKEVEGTCTIYLRDVTWKEALVAVLKMNDLVGYDEMGLIKVMSRADYESQRQAILDRQRQAKQASRLDEQVMVQVMKIHNARAEDVKATIDPLLGENDRPSVDLRTNSLVFTVTDSSLAVIRDIVRELDTETRQVAIEVKMVTVDAASVSEIGINWSAVKNGSNAEQNTIGEDGKLLIGTWAGTVSGAALEASLATLIDQNMAEIVSRPHVTTQDNEPAVVRSGQQVPVITYDESRNTVIELVDASTELTVTPHILSDNRILMEVSASRRSAEGVGVGLKINEELADVKMIVSNDETAVIGGMRQMHESQHESGIPILQDIPLIGQIFKYTNRSNRKTDLIIFITPHIVERVESQMSENVSN